MLMQKWAYLDSYQIEQKLYSQLEYGANIEFNERICPSWNSVDDYDEMDRLLEEKSIVTYKELVSDKRLQDDECWSYPYGNVDASIEFKCDGIKCSVFADIHVEAGSGFINDVSATISDEFNDEFVFDSSAIESAIKSNSGGATFWFDKNYKENFLIEAIKESNILSDFAYGIAERKEYNEMMRNSKRAKRDKSAKNIDEIQKNFERQKWNLRN